ncbi:MBL fold metallo-hydrolase [Actinomycetospora termitidis]|uniref:MBL fold metallo-hydrolase n=1 Tax=Actinomycetospora termitidis TaxID=3053470 RepID=A0ABT7M4Q9_9PSEU|nr:MBL fold metallo-hydrolase [Actinomycetospora sp. Odt1-22]MDL5155644.1 MBL fold metallo-hydrolase [Actinomycetospora sp. Odt1-22]
MSAVDVHPVVSPWGRFGLYSFFLDAPEPAVIDTGIATSPAEGLAPALAALGRDVSEIRWILLTHGHIDHLGGAHALWEMTGRRARVVIHEADAPLLRSRRAHADLYAAVRHRYLRDPEGIEREARTAEAVISGEMEPTVLLRGGESLPLGGGVSVSVHHTPGHTAGSVAYVVDGQDDVFVGDAVQVCGAANGFPGYADPDAYRASLESLRDEVRPRRLFLGHPYRDAGGVPYGVELDAGQARRALGESLEREASIAASAASCLAAGLHDTDSVYSPFEPVAADLAYDQDPRRDPSPFFTTLHGYRRHHERGAAHVR